MVCMAFHPVAIEEYCIKDLAEQDYRTAKATREAWIGLLYTEADDVRGTVMVERELL